MTTRLGVHMIVKDEAATIERCLASVRPLVDWWVVCDTGSTDGTQDLVRATMAGVPGALLERPWVSFGHNRQEALEAARDLEHSEPGDYTLWIDADDQLSDLPASLPELAADGYHLSVDFAGSRFQRLSLVRLDRPWRWQGVVHEFLDLPGASLGALERPRLQVGREGARSRDPDVFRKDAALLEAHLQQHPGDPRSEFYLAQSWRDAGEWSHALECYRVRVANPNGWDQERWFARYQVARCLERLGRTHDEVASAYLDAYAERPGRAEPLVELARLERSRERFEVAVLYARAAVAVPQPAPDALFVDVGAHGWRAWDELAVSCYWTGRDDEGLPAARRAVAMAPADQRLRDNVEWFQRRRAAPSVS